MREGFTEVVGNRVPKKGKGLGREGESDTVLFRGKRCILRTGFGGQRGGR